MPINPVDLKPGDVFTCDELPFIACLEVIDIASILGPGMRAYHNDGQIHWNRVSWPTSCDRWANCELVDRSVLIHLIGRFAGEGI